VTHIRLAAFDNDGTLHPAKGVWSYLQKPLGLWEGEGKSILMEHLEGDLPYTPMVERTIARWAGRHESEFLAVIRELPLRPHAIPLITGLQAAGVKCVVLSSGIHWWKQVWAEQYGIHFDRYLTNIVEVDEAGICTGKVRILATDDSPETGKGYGIRQWQTEWGITKEETFAFGDGGGDIPMLQQAGIAVCVDPSSDQVRVAAHSGELLSGDLAGLTQFWPELGTLVPGLTDTA